MRRSYDGGTEVHPGEFLPERTTLGVWAHPGAIPQHAFQVRWGAWAGGWWAETTATIAGGRWTFTDRDAAEAAVAAMLAEQPGDEWTPPVSEDGEAGPEGSAGRSAS